MANQYVNKVEYGSDTLIDLTSDTVTASTLLSGYTAHDRSGAPIVGVAVSGGYTVNFSTTNPDLYGATITIKQGSTVIGTVAFDNTGSASYTLSNSGTYTWSVTLEGETYTDTFVVAAPEVYIETTFVYRDWLVAGGLNPSDYADLPAVLADEEAVRQLMTIHAAVDYLASFNPTDASVITILNNDYAAKWISLRDYAEDILEAAYGTLMASIGKYGYGEWGLVGKVPKMTSATAPYGEASADMPSGVTTYSAPYLAFDGDTSTKAHFYASSAFTGKLIYHFLNPVVVKEVYVKPYVDTNGAYLPSTGTLLGSNDGTNYTSIGTVNSSANGEYSPIANNTAYSYYAVQFASVKYGSADYLSFVEVQFLAYAPKGNVPIMTSNTAPYGEVSCKDNSVYDNKYPWYVFDGKSYNQTTYWVGTAGANGWIQYKFANPTRVRRISLTEWNNGCTYEVYVGNDPNNLTKVSTVEGRSYQYNGIPIIQDIADNDIYGLYVRVVVSVLGSGSYSALSKLQFYGRTLKVSVPKMTSNTAPYGEASLYRGWSDNTNAYKCFDQNTSTSDYSQTKNTVNSDVGRFVYEFPSPVAITMVAMMDNAFAYDANLTGNIQYSDDGTTWTNTNVTLALANTVKTAVLSAIGAHKFWGVYFNTGKWLANHSVYSVTVTTLQFYGKDYSEREWDTSHPRRYLYDHGVELETIATSGHDSAYGNGYTTRYPHFKADGAEIGENVATVFYPFVTDAKVDVTNYDVLAVVYEPFNSYGSTTDSQCGRVGATASKNPSDGYYLGASYTTLVRAKTDPYTIADFSSLNGEYYIGVVTDENGRMDTIKELWLE